MILVRVLLGEPYLQRDQKPPQYRKPPCCKCLQDSCDCNTETFNSVVDDVRLFREFVVYDQNVAYPEYFITYKRI